jgi:hypothetical protein
VTRSENQALEPLCIIRCTRWHLVSCFSSRNARRSASTEKWKVQRSRTRSHLKLQSGCAMLVDVASEKRIIGNTLLLILAPYSSV